MAQDSQFKLSDRNALISGPVSSVNQSIARKLTELGCNVALLDRNIEKASRFADQLNSSREVNERFGRAVAIQADLSKQHHVTQSVSKAAESFGGLDIFIEGLMTTDVRDFRDPGSLDDLDRLIDVNLKAALMTTHAVLKYLEGRKRGRIVYLDQMYAHMGMQKNALLAMTRGGLHSFAKTLAQEVRPSNVTVNVVSIGASEEFLLAQVVPSTAGGERGSGAPGPSDSSGIAAQSGAQRSMGAMSGSINSGLELLRKYYPNAQLLDCERVANAVAFLVSPLGMGVNGQVVEVL